jgi:putative DNA primase/helicase
MILDDDGLREGAADSSVSDYTGRSAANAADAHITPSTCNDVANGRRLAKALLGKALFNTTSREWLFYRRGHWQRDVDGGVIRAAKAVANGIYFEAAKCRSDDARKALAKWAGESHSAARIMAMVSMAQSEFDITASQDVFDSQPFLLNYRNVTLDLRDGAIRKHSRDDYLTRLIPYDYPTATGSDPVLWLEFLHQTFAGNQGLIAFVQRLMGYSMVAGQTEHILPILYGSGANGKTVFCEVWKAALGVGEYSMTCRPGFLTATAKDHPTGLADLFGIRLAICEETEDGHGLNESLVKSITGGGRLRARRMREDHWEFEATHLPVLVTNHKPIVRGNDYGIWRRLRIIPFAVTVPPDRQDKRLREKLLGELPTIARWMAAGALEVQKAGLQEPSEVLLATEAYRADSDTAARWLDDCVERSRGARLGASIARASYEAWCHEVGETPIGSKKFAQFLAEHSDDKIQSNGVHYGGLRLLEARLSRTLEGWSLNVA